MEEAVAETRLQGSAATLKPAPAFITATSCVSQITAMPRNGLLNLQRAHLLSLMSVVEQTMAFRIFLASIAFISISAVADSNSHDEDTSSICGSKYYCKEMTSCEEAMHYLHDCGLTRLDGDSDGIPCESICQKEYDEEIDPYDDRDFCTSGRYGDC